MSDVERVSYEVELKTRFDAATKEVREITEELEELESTGEKLDQTSQDIVDAGRKIAKSMEAVSEAAKDANGDLKVQTAAYEDLLKKQKEWAAAARTRVQARLAANPASTDGTGLDETRKLGDDEIARRLAIDDAATQNEISNLRKVQAERKKAAEAQAKARREASKSEAAFEAQRQRDHAAANAANAAIDKKAEAERLAAVKTLADFRARTSAAVKSGSAASEVSKLDKETAAQKRLTDAQREYRNAKSQQTRAVASGDTDKQLAAEKRLLAAVLEKNKATATVGDLRKAAAAKEIAAIDSVAKAEREAAQKLADFRSKTIGANYTAGQAVVNGATNVGQKDAHVKARDDYSTKQIEAASKQTAIYNQYLYDEAKAADKARTAQDSHTESLIAARYALYDVASSYGVVSAALIGASALTVKTGADFESAFTGVERTSQGTSAELSVLRDNLVDLSTTMPLTYEQLTTIATLGNQLGIASGDVEGFTGTVARFAAVTGMSVEASATAFGSLGELLNLTAADYEALGSSIAYVGRTSVATEPEIVALATRLAASATAAGFTAQEVVALSGAFASLRIAPERAQGVMEVYFKTLNTAISEGGPRLEAFAHYAGVTAGEVRGLVEQDPTAFFRSLSAGLGTLDKISQTTALDQLGLSGIRAGEVFGRVAGNINVFDKALKDSNSSYASATELATQYALVADDLNSKFQELVNSVNALIAEFSGGNVDGIAGIAGALVDVVNAAREFVGTPLGQHLSTIILGISIATGLFLAYRTGMILATASTLAFRTAQAALAGTGAVGGIRGLLVALGLYTGAANGATGATFSLTTALRVLGRVVVIGAVISALSEIIFNFNGSMRAVVPVLTGLQGTFISMARTVVAVMRTIGSALGPLGGIISAGGDALAGYADLGDDVRKSVEGWVDSLPKDEVVDLGNGVDDLNGSMYGLDESAGAGGDALEVLGDQADAAAAKVYTLVDYANDLGGIVNRAFDIRYGAGAAADAITTATRAIEDGFAEADKEVAKLNSDLVPLQEALATSFADTFADTFGDTLREGFTEAFDAAFAKSSAADAIITSFRSLTSAIEESRARLAQLQADLFEIGADRNIKQYQLAVAIDYGDTLRADKLRAELGDLALKQAKAEADIRKEALGQGRETTGNSDAAIANRAALQGLVSQYQKYLTVLVDAGGSSEDITKAAEEAREAFEEQGETLGFSNDQLANYSALFASFSTAAAVAQIEANRAALAAQAAAQKAVTDAVAALKLAEDAASRSLEGNSAAAIANRAAIQDLLQKNNEYITALASSGASQAVLAAESERLRGAFVSQMTQAGFSTNAIYTYARTFDDLTYSIQRLPRDITVTANVNPAAQAFDEFWASLRATAGSGVNIPITSSFDGGGAAKSGRGMLLQSEIAILTTQLALESNVFKKMGFLAQIAAKSAILNSGGYRDGGYTGNGGVNDVAGAVHGKEFVFSAPAVKNIGVQNLAHAHEMAKRGQSVDFGRDSGSSSGSSRGGNNGIQVVELSAYDRDLLRNSGQFTAVLDGKVVADSNSQQNTISARKGSN